MKKIGLDIDGVLAQFSKGMVDKAIELGLTGYPTRKEDVSHWDHLSDCGDLWKRIKYDESFWLYLEPFPDALPIDFEVTRYITSRPIGNEISYFWLWKNGFPNPERCTTVPNPDDKLEVLRQIGIDVFVDDRIETCHQIQDAGIQAILFNAPYQRGHAYTGLVPIYSLKEVRGILSP